MSPLDNLSVCESVSVCSDIDQLDGNVSVFSHNEGISNSNDHARPGNSHRIRNASVAHHLPVVTVCNLRSLFPKIQNFKNDFFEHQVDVSLCCEVWEKAEDRKHKAELVTMFELQGLKYFSTPRPRGKRGGGAAIICNTDKFHIEKLDIQIPHHLEIVWALAKPKAETAEFKRIILCS